MFRSHILIRLCLLSAMLLFCMTNVSHAENLAQPTTIQEDSRNISHEVIALKDGRFLMWRSEFLSYQSAVTGVIMRIENGVPSVETTYMELFDEQSNVLSRVNTVEFGAGSWHFDPGTSILTLDSKDGYVAEYKHTYLLNHDSFMLLKLVKSEFTNCTPEQSCESKETLLYEAKHHAKTY